MSNYLAIATVTATLQVMLQAAVDKDVAGATATIVRPDGSDNGLPKLGVNIYLYQVSPNAAWRNADLPTRSGDGRVVRKPRVALDLHYLLTFYGNDKELEPQRVLGSVVRTLHAQPLLSRDLIASAVGSISHLTGSDLAVEVESVKFMPLSLSLEELSKLWSVFFQTPYSLSMAYLATTVLIEGKEAPSRPLPVRVRHIHVAPFRSAVIEEVLSAEDEDAAIVFGDTAVLRGRGLGGEVVGVRIGAAELVSAEVSAREIRIGLTDPNLRAGVQGVRVRYANGSESDTAPLVLRPIVAKDAGGNHQITITPGDPLVLGVTLAPAVGRRQQARLYLNPTPSAAGRAYVFAARPLASDAATVQFEIPGVGPGDYLVRVEVEGAETMLETDTDGRYQAPVVTVS
jgi:hypothetical protein